MPAIVSSNSTERNRQQLQGAFDFALEQVDRLVAKYPTDYYPMYTVYGEFGKDTSRWTHWCDGFYPGLMFLFAARTGSELWLDRAVKRSIPLEPRQYDRSVHDLGFLFLSTYARWLELGGPAERIAPVLQQAGRTMAMRFMERGQYLRSFVEPSSLFIDIMMNVGTIFHAGYELQDKHLLAIANQHCLTTRRVLVRGDGSTAHEAQFDLTSGECIRQSTHQGYRGDSCWSRGLAWSMYGFTRSFKQTGDPEYLQTAMSNAHFWLTHCSHDGIAPWDFDAPVDGPLARTLVDTSASAIASAALLDLAGAVSDPILAITYAQCAIRTLVSLATNYLGSCTPGFEGILNGGVYHIHKSLGVHEAVMFGEYFFVEALDKALNYLDHEHPPIQTVAYPEDTLPQEARNWHDGPLSETGTSTEELSR